MVSLAPLVALGRLSESRETRTRLSFLIQASDGGYLGSILARGVAAVC
jgi:hypothetical protein